MSRDCSNAARRAPPGLVILLVETLQDAAPEAGLCRREWPDTRIVVLYDRCGLHDVRTLSSYANALLPTCISQETLLHALDLLAQEEGDIAFLLEARSTVTNSGRSDAAREAALEPPKGNPSGNRGNGQDGNDHSKLRAIAAATVNPKPGIIPKLSQREIAILDGLVHGFRNKEIARTCGIAELTVKVHMKSILRKLQVVNRTQAAVWALENSEAIAQLESASARNGRIQFVRIPLAASPPGINAIYKPRP